MDGANYSDDELFEHLQNGNYRMLNALYRRYRSDYLEWAQRRYNCADTQAADSFQDAVVVLYKNIKSGKLQQLSSSLKTYLYAIAKRLLLKELNRSGRMQNTDPDDLPLLSEVDLTVYQRIEHDHQRSVLMNAMGKLNEKCREILRLFYYHDYPIESIQEAMGFPSEVAVRVQKKRCLDRLRNIITPS